MVTRTAIRIRIIPPSGKFPRPVSRWGKTDIAGHKIVCDRAHDLLSTPHSRLKLPL
jgi:hypothetical protein